MKKKYNFKKSKLLNPEFLAQDLIKKNSVTPLDNGAIKCLKDSLTKLGFNTKELVFKGNKNNEEKVPIKNLFAIRKSKYNPNAPVLCFAGHTDVVPPGNLKNWKYDPFSGVIKNNILYGRGASDMKGSISSWVSACARFISKEPNSLSLALMITGDEEGTGINGTVKIVKWLKENKIKINHCIVGEPTNPNYIGEMIKIGRRGSLCLKLSVFGKSGHVAYPNLAMNPLPNFFKMCESISEINLNQPSKEFPLSNIEFTSVKTDFNSSNVIPRSAEAYLNIRYNPRYNTKSLIKKLKLKCNLVSENYSLDVVSSNEPFYNKQNKFTDILKESIKQICKKNPILSTTGGTSDARFIKNLCPVIEFGATGKTMHQINEQISIKDLNLLSDIYEKFIINYSKVFLK